jgi:DNA-binding NtrC family response regulator
MVWLGSYPKNSNVILTERNITEDLIKVYGENHVRGGPWCRIDQFGNPDQEAEYASDIAPGKEDSLREDVEGNNKEIIDYLKDVSYEEKDVLDATWWKEDKVTKRIKKDMKSMGFPEERKKTLLEIIPEVLMQKDGDIAATAAALSLSYDNLYDKIKDLNMYEGTADYRRTREKLYSLLLKHDGNLDKMGLELFGMKVWSAGRKIAALLLEHNIEIPKGKESNEAKWGYFFDKYGPTYLKDMLEKHDFVVTEVAKELDVNPNFLYRTLKRTNILY